MKFGTKRTSLVALLLSLVMLISLFPQGPAYADDTTQGMRMVYLHAFDETPKLDSSLPRRTVHMGDDVNVFLAVDNPNKSTYLPADDPSLEEVANIARDKATLEAEGKTNLDEAGKAEFIQREVDKAVEAARHTEPWYDMQGYTVKIYFDTNYFKFKDTTNPINFKEPNETNGFEIVDGEEIKEEIKINTNLNPGYMTHRPVYSQTGRKGYAAVTVFLMNNGFFPNKSVSKQDLWYNLCRLTLTPIQPGNTSVRIEYRTGDDYDLELFAKNYEDKRLNFNTEVKNDGVFYITIEEAGKPTRPIATIPGGVYNDAQEVRLYHENNEPCEIWFSTNGTDPINKEAEGVRLYRQNEVIDISRNQTIKARTYRTSDDKWSDLAEFTYEFLPKAPFLFNSEHVRIPFIYTEPWKSDGSGYYVYTSDNENVNDGINPDSTIYYTFKQDLSPDYVKGENSYVGDDPETQWVAVSGITQRIDTMIDRSRTIRLVTSNKFGISEVSSYRLGIKPAAVTATPSSGLDVPQPVTLDCATPNAVIYYTTNGDDPRKSTRNTYGSPINLAEDTVIKAVSYYDGQWSDVTSFWYIFSDKNKSGVSAVYPSGIYTGSVEVILYPDEPGGEIEVSFDGGQTWTPYDGTINGDTTTVDTYTEFNARIKSDDNDEDDHGDKFVYVIKPLDPVFSPESCEFSSADYVTVYSPESTNDNKNHFELWYSIDGSDPDGSLKAPDNDVVNIPVTGYTEIRAVVVKDGQYMSDIVSNIYTVAYDKPAKPSVTLPSGKFYEREIGSEEFTTQFVTPPQGTVIYYTIGDISTDFNAPDITTPGGAIKYENGTDIPLTNGTLIKAVSVQTVNGRVIKSDVATFYYEITPEAPVAPSKAVVTNLPLIPVDAVAAEKEEGSERGTVYYTIGNDTEGKVDGFFCTDEENTDGHIRFYIDTATGNAYKDENKTELLFDGQRTEPFTQTVILELKSELDGVESGTNAYAYIIGDSDTTLLTPPYADKESGTYTESNTPFTVKFYSIYEDRNDITIQWKYDGETEWSNYDPDNPPTFKTKDTIIYARTADEQGNVSPSAGYIYTFNPPPPDITPGSGIYLKSEKRQSQVSQSSDIPAENINDYDVYYKVATDLYWVRAKGSNFIPAYNIDRTLTVMAYTYNSETKRVSETVSRSYVVVDSNTLGSAVTIKWPFNQKRISAHLLGKGEYANGIQFLPETDVYYEYIYTLTREAGGGTYQVGPVLYDEKTAFVPTERIDYMTLTAWISGDKYNTEYPHAIDFVHLDIPKTDLPVQTEYTKNTKYHLVNDNKYVNDPTYILYYTLNDTDPTLESQNRKTVTVDALGAEETLEQTTTVKAVYFSACGDAECPQCSVGNYSKCPDGVYGEVAEYKYPVPTTVTVGGGGGGGGSKTIDNTRKYTLDIFGNEHPTHIGYINGYPDGSVQADGYITREEIAAILYRIINHEYEKPFIETGEVFPDVKSERWSAHDIEYIADKGIVYGYPDGEFKPGRNLTRAEFAALIYRFTGVEEAKDKDNPFTDLDESHWAYSNILSIAEAGLVIGYEDSTFKPENNITRAEVMTVINKILGRKPLESYVKSLEFNPYTDLVDSKWYYVTVLEATITHNYWLDSKGYEYKWEDWK